MTDFTPLKNILSMNFSEMRQLPCDGGMRASDEALLSLLTNFNVFFAQFKNKQPTKEDFNQFNEFMQEIVNKVNESEYSYYLKKYALDGEVNQMFEMAEAQKLKNWTQLPARIQFWAADEQFGTTLRNALEFRQAASSLQSWGKKIPTKCTTQLFKASISSFNLDGDDDSPSAHP